MADTKQPDEGVTSPAVPAGTIVQNNHVQRLSVLRSYTDEELARYVRDLRLQDPIMVVLRERFVKHAEAHPLTVKSLEDLKAALDR